MEAKHCTNCDVTEGGLADHKGGAATCTEKAVCEVCGKAYGEPAGHEWVEANCTDPKHCSKCDVTEGVAKGHRWDAGAVTKNATCTESGARTYTCMDCSETKAELIPAPEHAYTDRVVAPTCTEKGYTEHTCPNCSTSYRDTEVAAKGHRWDHATQSCANERTCLDCSETEAAPAHTYALTSTEAATCTAPEKNHYTCGGCGDTYTETSGSALRHDFTGSTMTERAIAENGCRYEQLYHCARCNQDIVTDTVTHHRYQASIKKEATCSANGVKALTCKSCGHYTTETIEKNENGHLWGAGELNGTIRTYHCTAGCGKTKTAVDASAEISAAVRSSDLSSAKEVRLKNASLALDQKTLDSIGRKDVTLSAGTLEGDVRAEALKNLSEEQKKQLGDNPVYNFTMTDGKDAVDFDGGFVTVTIPYTLSEGEDVDHIAVWYVNGTTVETIPATYSNGSVTFRVSHFSYYTVTRLTPKQRCALYGHSETRKDIPATCLSDGYTLVVCVRCAESWKENEVSAKGHQYVRTAVAEVSCTSDGKESYTCSGCGDHYENRIPATGHRWEVTSATEADCTKAGSTVYTCTACETTVTETVPQLVHKFIETVVAPACEVNGYTLHRCEACSYEYRDASVAATGHVYVVGWGWAENHATATPTVTCKNCSLKVSMNPVTATEIRTESTCQVRGGILYTVRVSYNGVLYEDSCREELAGLAPHRPSAEKEHDGEMHWSYCTVCKEKLAGEKHTFGEGEQTTAPTCNTEGEAVYRCACGYEKTEKIPATGEHRFEQKGYNDNTHYEICSGCGMFRNEEEHTLTETVTREANCTVAGERKLRCACGYERTEQIPVNPDAHSTEGGEVIGEEDGHYSTCAICGNTVGEKTAHIFGEGVVTKEPTCAEPGCLHRSCTVCNFSIDEPIPTTGDHVYLEEWDYDDGSHWHCCVLCGRNTVSEKAEHTFEREEVVEEASCGRSGRKRLYCFCGYFKEETIPATGNHQYDETLHFDDNEHYKVCRECRQEFDRESHTFDEGEIVFQPDCVHTGERMRHCTTCLAVRSEMIPATGTHVFGENGPYRISDDGHRLQCTVCGTAGEPIAHTFEDTGDVIMKATCSNTGRKYIRCTVCDYHTEADTPRNPDVHEAIYWTYDEEYHFSSCSACGKQVTQKAAHAGFGEWVVERQPTCGDAGEKRSYCACGYYRTEAVPATGNHTPESVWSGLEEDGHYYRCMVCSQPVGYEKHAYVADEESRLAPTCNTDGLVQMYCKCGSSRTEKLPATGNHVYTNNYQYADGEGHWLCCDVCGTPSEEKTPHSMDGEVVLTRQPNCTEGGEGYILCVCGYQTYMQVPADKNVHDYVDGICSRCRKQDPASCDHTVFTEKTLDLTAYGVCGGKLTVQVCACGAVTRLDAETFQKEVQSIPCFADNTIRFSITTETETEGTCSRCGMYVYGLLGYQSLDGKCTVQYTTTYTMRIGDITFLKNAIQQMTLKQHGETEDAVIDMKTAYGACEGGIVKVSVCKTCGEMVSDPEIQPKCKADGITSTTYTDPDGYEHTVQSVVCKDCGLTYTMDSVEKSTTCTKWYEMVMTVNRDKTELLRSERTQYSPSTHEYLYTYDFNGKTCEDGYTIHARCTKCGDAYLSTGSGHQTDGTGTDTDLSDYSACYPKLRIQTCSICGKAVSVELIGCDSEPSGDGEKTETGEDGKTYHIMVSACVDCGLRLEMRYYIDPIDTCRDAVFGHYRVYAGEECPAEGDFVFTDVHHQIKETYSNRKGTCEEGYDVEEVCTVCGLEWNYFTKGHREVLRTEDYSEKVPCGVAFNVYECAVCKELISIFPTKLGCKIVWGQTVAETDADGIVHNRTNGVCETCGTAYATDEYVTTVDTCRSVYHHITTISGTDSTVIAQFATTENRVSHEIQRDYKMLGETCESGYEFTDRCTKCGESFGGGKGSGHDFGETKRSLSDIISCDGYVLFHGCRICHAEENVVEIFVKCEIEWSERTETIDGLEHRIRTGICRNCGRRHFSDEWSVMKSDCEGERFGTYSIYDGDTELTRFSRSFGSFSTHRDVCTLTPNGDSCENGYVCIRTCTVCGHTEEERGEWHVLYPVSYVDLAANGACRGTIEIHTCACGKEKKLYFDECEGMTVEWYEYTDDNGVHHELDKRTCPVCGLTVTSDRYSIKTEGTCEKVNHTRITVTVKGKAVLSEELSPEIVGDHTFEKSLQLKEGSTSCLDGVIVTNRCSVCGRTESYTENYHETVETERLELSSFGAVCGGNLVIHSCACGAWKTVDMDGIKCHFDIIGVGTEWLGETLLDNQWTVDGIYLWFGPTADRYTCAVTEPACGFVIRYGNYWVADENSCSAVRYTRWQIGYHEATDTCEREILVENERAVYHHYGAAVEETTTDENGNEIVTSTKTCSLCGSFTRNTRMNGADGTLLREETHVENRLSDEGLKSYTETIDFTYLPEGDFTSGSRITRTRIATDGSERDYYEIISGQRNGEGYNIFEFRRSDGGAYTEKREYTYDFTTCTVTIVTTYGDGKSNTETKNVHRMIYDETTLEPTCTQYGKRTTHCCNCGMVEAEAQIPPRGHQWNFISDGLYRCNHCGMENANGADGDIEMEDLTGRYGNEDTYVVGIRNRNNISYVYYVSLVLHTPEEDGNDEIVLSGISIAEHKEPYNGFSFQRSAVEAAAGKLGYAVGTYDIRFTMVPKDAAGNLDYGLTFTQAEQAT